MFAIKARFDGQKIMPEEPIPVNKPCEAIVTFTGPANEPEKPHAKNLVEMARRGELCPQSDDFDEFYGCFSGNSPWEGDSVAAIRKVRDEW